MGMDKELMQHNESLKDGKPKSKYISVTWWKDCEWPWQARSLDGQALLGSYETAEKAAEVVARHHGINRLDLMMNDQITETEREEKREALLKRLLEKNTSKSNNNASSLKKESAEIKEVVDKIAGVQADSTKIEYDEASDEDIAVEYGRFIESNYRVDKIWDVSKLPYPKERIMTALIRLYAKETTSEYHKTCMANTFIMLSQFQEGVGSKVLCPLGAENAEDFELGETGDVEATDKLMRILEANKIYEKYNEQVKKEMHEILPDKLKVGIAMALTEKKK